MPRWLSPASMSAGASKELQWRAAQRIGLLMPPTGAPKPFNPFDVKTSFAKASARGRPFLRDIRPRSLATHPQAGPWLRYHRQALHGASARRLFDPVPCGRRGMASKPLLSSAVEIAGWKTDQRDFLPSAPYGLRVTSTCGLPAGFVVAALPIGLLWTSESLDGRDDVEGWLPSTEDMQAVASSLHSKWRQDSGNSDPGSATHITNTSKSSTSSVSVTDVVRRIDEWATQFVFTDVPSLRMAWFAALTATAQSQSIANSPKHGSRNDIGATTSAAPPYWLSSSLRWADAQWAACDDDADASLHSIPGKTPSNKAPLRRHSIDLLTELSELIACKQQLMQRGGGGNFRFSEDEPPDNALVAVEAQLHRCYATMAHRSVAECLSSFYDALLTSQGHDPDATAGIAPSYRCFRAAYRWVRNCALVLTDAPTSATTADGTHCSSSSKKPPPSTAMTSEGWSIGPVLDLMMLPQSSSTSPTAAEATSAAHASNCTIQLLSKADVVTMYRSGHASSLHLALPGLLHPARGARRVPPRRAGLTPLSSPDAATPIDVSDGATEEEMSEPWLVAHTRRAVRCGDLLSILPPTTAAPSEEDPTEDGVSDDGFGVMIEYLWKAGPHRGLTP